MKLRAHSLLNVQPNDYANTEIDLYPIKDFRPMQILKILWEQLSSYGFASVGYRR